ncbi:MAG: CNNM domain-containing protein, partial [Armatimonadota bacterium]
MEESDPSSLYLQLLLIFVLILLNGFFAAAEIALVSVRRTRIKQLVEEGNSRAITVQNLIEKPTRFMATVQIGVTLVGFLASAFAAVNIADGPAKWLISLGFSEAFAYNIAVVFITVIVGSATLVAGEIAPKSLAMQHAEKLSLFVAGPISFLSTLALPAVKVIGFFSDLLVKPFGGQVKFSSPILTEEEIRMLVETGEEEGIIESEEKQMIHSIFDFGDTVARQVMVPRTDMHTAPSDCTLDDLLDLISSTGHSRIPIYEDNVDNIIGVV